MLKNLRKKTQFLLNTLYHITIGVEMGGERGKFPCLSFSKLQEGKVPPPEDLAILTIEREKIEKVCQRGQNHAQEGEK